jgi:signal transduction histidine kinase/AmiR/NasT family two-component response regulator/HPt (histidine-containing phosphotransfer) domain-containing protein
MEAIRYQDLKVQYEQARSEKDKIDILIQMALDLREGDPEAAMNMADEIIERSELANYLAGVGNGYNHRGACYWIMGEYEDGLDELTEAYVIAKEIKDSSLEAKVLNNFGRIYRNLGDLDSALRDFEAALEINEKLGIELNQTINLTNISNLYYDLGDYDTALEYALKCQPIFEKYNEPSRLATIYQTLGEIYFKKNFFDEALEYFQKAHKLSEENTQSSSLANSGIGKVYYKLNNLPKANEYLQIGFQQAKELNSPESEIVASFYLGRLLVLEGSYNEALEYMEHARELAKDSLRRHDLMSIQEYLADLYDKLDNIPKAYEHLKAYESLKEDIFQQATLNKLRNLQIKNQIEVAKKEKEVAERTAYLKQQFMANMSHEIRTPMNAIVGITRLLLEKDPKPEQIKYLNIIKQSSDNLLVIINDILDLSKIEAGKIVIEHISFSLRDLFYGIEQIMVLKAEEKGLNFKVQLDSKVPDQFLGDPTRVNQILINLVGNAIKFTDKGSINLLCSLVQQDETSVTLKMDVKDTGIGISKDYVGKIFESFTQAGTDTARKFGGTGLGLTISKQLVDLMQGNISVESEQGVGTTFSVTLPLAIDLNPSAKEIPNVMSEEDYNALNNIKLLLVEDNEFNRLVAEDTLKSVLPNISISIAENGAIAVEKITHNHYDIVLMDIQMPIMDGVTATEKIRKSLPSPKNKIGIIAMTANVLQEDVKRYLDAGMNAYISKPFQTEDLLSKIAVVLELNGRTGATDNDIPAKDGNKGVGNIAALPSKVTDLSFLDQFTGGNQEKKKKYINMFLDNAPKLLEKIKNAAKDKDFEALRVAAHSMKPQMSYMGIQEETSNIFLIEQSAGQMAHREQLDDLITHLDLLCQKVFIELQQELV